MIDAAKKDSNVDAIKSQHDQTPSVDLDNAATSSTTSAPEVRIKTMSSMPYAGFWWRMVPFQIDMALSMVIASFMILGGTRLYAIAFNAPAPAWMSMLILTLTVWIYYAWMESSSWKGTFGKRFFGLRVVDMKGKQLSFTRASLHFLFRILSWSLCAGGFFFILFSKKKQTLHDQLSHCLVVRKVNSAPILKFLRWLPANILNNAKFPSWLIMAFISIAVLVSCLNMVSYFMEPYFLRLNARDVVAASIAQVKTSQAFIGEQKVATGKYPDAILPAISQSMKVPGGVSVRYLPVAGMLELSFSANPNLLGKKVLLSPVANRSGVDWSCVSERIENVLLPSNCRGTK